MSFANGIEPMKGKKCKRRFFLYDARVLSAIRSPSTHCVSRCSTVIFCGVACVPCFSSIRMSRNSSAACLRVVIGSRSRVLLSNFCSSGPSSRGIRYLTA